MLDSFPSVLCNEDVPVHGVLLLRLLTVGGHLCRPTMTMTLIISDLALIKVTHIRLQQVDYKIRLFILFFAMFWLPVNSVICRN